MARQDKPLQVAGMSLSVNFNVNSIIKCIECINTIEYKAHCDVYQTFYFCFLSGFLSGQTIDGR